MLRNRRLSNLSSSHTVQAIQTPTTVANMTIIAIACIVALYIGRPVFIPLAIALILAFVLGPVITGLRRLYVPRTLAVVLSVLFLFLAVLGTGAIIAQQVTGLSRDLPRYQIALVEKLRTIRNLTGQSDAVDSASRALKTLQNELEKKEPERPIAKGPYSAPVPPEDDTGSQSGGDGKPEPEPVPVVVKEEQRVLDTIQSVLDILITPLATTGIVFVFLTFILLQREDVRDRMIRLFGSTDLERTTMAMDDAGKRLSRFLLTQTTINLVYGTIIGLSVWALGLPSPVLWGVIAFLMRFVPFIGSPLAAGFPLILAAAVDPTWTTFWWTLGLYAVGEFTMGQAVEPILQGQSTGLSPLAIVVSASFWTLLWGPIGLMLAVPLTVCLVTLGRHVKRLEFLHVILGDTPALAPEQKFYQRALAGDADEATEDAEIMLREMSLATYCDTVALKALRLAQENGRSDRLNDERGAVMRRTVDEIMENLTLFGDRKVRHLWQGDKSTDEDGNDDVPDAAATDSDGAHADDPAGGSSTAQTPPQQKQSRHHGVVACVAGRTRADEAAAGILARVLQSHDIEARVIPYRDASPAKVLSLDIQRIESIVVSSLSSPDDASALRFLVRRLRRVLPDSIPIRIGFWGSDPHTHRPEALAEKLEADGVVWSSEDALAIYLAPTDNADDPDDDPNRTTGSEAETTSA